MPMTSELKSLKPFSMAEIEMKGTTMTWRKMKNRKKGLQVSILCPSVSNGLMDNVHVLSVLMTCSSIFASLELEAGLRGSQ